MKRPSIPLAAAILAVTACGDSSTPTAPAHETQLTAITSSAYDCAAQTAIPQSECLALVALYNSTDGPNWANNTNWLAATSTPCDWYAVDCFAGSVSQLSLNGNQLNGSIPSEIGDFASMHYLGLADNTLSGSIPAEFGNLSSLVYTHLYNSQLSGPIPPELGNLANLEGIQAGGNQLSGAIPAELGNLSNLKRLNLAYNQLSGTIPSALGNLSNLEDLGIQANNLTGTIPVELGNLSTLVYLQLYQNQLTGQIPAALGGLGALQLLNLHGNQLYGLIPAELGNLTSLETLELHENQLSGAIPASLGNLDDLTSFWLEDNQLQGQVPIEVATLGGGMDHCSFRDNYSLYMPDTEPYSDADQNKDGYICGLALSSIVPVAIDISPGSYPNPINLGAMGRIPVAILSSTDFDAAAVDPATVTLGDNYGGETGVATRNNGSLMAGVEDVDGNGYLDLVLHFEVQALVANGDVNEYTTLLILNGATMTGVPIRGEDTVRIVP